MYIETTKGKRFFYHKSRNVPTDKSIQALWPSGSVIWWIVKTRPNIAQQVKNICILYFKSEVINHLMINKNDIIAMYNDNKYRYFNFNNSLSFSVDKFVENYNKANGTDYKYISCGKEYNKVAYALSFDAHSASDISSINALPDDFKIAVEVYNREDFKPITEYTKKEKEFFAQQKIKDANKSIFNTFLKTEVEKILEEYGLYYNDYFESFRFKSTKDFRLFLIKAVNEIIGEKLKEHGIYAQPAIGVKCIRSSKIDCESLDIINICDIAATEEVNNE